MLLSIAPNDGISSRFEADFANVDATRVKVRK